MNFIKNFFSHDKAVIGLSGIRKKREYVIITVPEGYKKTYIPNIAENYMF